MSYVEDHFRSSDAEIAAEVGNPWPWPGVDSSCSWCHFCDMKRVAAVFDFDGTLARGDSAAPFTWFMLRRMPSRLLHLPGLATHLAAYACRWQSKKGIKNRMLRVLHGVDAGTVRRLVADFWLRHLEPRLYSQGLERVSWHREQKHLLVLATASVDTYMQLAADKLGFDLLVATRTTGGEHPTIAGANCYGEEKVNRLRALDVFANIDWSRSFAYSDHVSDEPLLRLCGNPVAVNPHRPLRRLADREGWPVVCWR